MHLNFEFHKQFKSPTLLTNNLLLTMVILLDIVDKKAYTLKIFVDTNIAATRITLLFPFIFNVKFLSAIYNNNTILLTIIKYQ